jgi:hypothetical protein
MANLEHLKQSTQDVIRLPLRSHAGIGFRVAVMELMEDDAD